MYYPYNIGTATTSPVSVVTMSLLSTHILALFVIPNPASNLKLTSIKMNKITSDSLMPHPTESSKYEKYRKIHKNLHNKPKKTKH